MDNKRLSFMNLYKFIGAFLIAVFLHYHDHFIFPSGRLKNYFFLNDTTAFLSIYSYCFVELFFIFSGILLIINHICQE